MFQALPFFGLYKKKREELEMKKNQENHFNGNMCRQSQSDSVLSNTPERPVPRVQDIIGLALTRIGKFNDLDKEHQVVAVINDVSIPNYA